MERVEMFTNKIIKKCEYITKRLQYKILIVVDYEIWNNETEVIFNFLDLNRSKAFLYHAKAELMCRRSDYIVNQIIKDLKQFNFSPLDTTPPHML